MGLWVTFCILYTFLYCLIFNISAHYFLIIVINFLFKVQNKGSKNIKDQ